MRHTATFTSPLPINPLDELEDLISGQGFSYLRFEDEIIVRYPKILENLQSLWVWDKTHNSFEVSASSLLKIPKSKKQDIFELLALINEHLWVGHFDLSDEECPTFRHVNLVGDSSSSIPAIVEDMFAIVLYEYQRFKPAFDYVIKHHKSPQEAIKLALIEPQGEA